MRTHRRVIAVNEVTGEVKVFEGTYDAALEFHTSNGTIINAIKRCGSTNGWAMYDEPDRIRKRISELEEQIKFLESIEIE